MGRERFAVVPAQPFIDPDSRIMASLFWCEDMGPTRKDDDTLSDAETVRRREAALKRMLSTPPQPHKPLKAKLKKVRQKRAASAKRETA
jgi:hypothetical protein